MTTDHLIHKYQPGPTLPPLRPFSFPSSQPSESKFSRHSLSHQLNRPTQSASPIPHSNQSSQTANTASRSNQHHHSYHPYQHVNSKVSPRREREPDRQSNSAVLSPEQSLDRQNNNLSPHPNDHGKYTNAKRASLVPPTASNSNIQHLQQLKRTASRAELDHQPSRTREDVYHSEDKLINHGQPKFNSQGHHEKEVFVKPEYLTPHLPSQPLPSEPTHSPSHTPSDSSASGAAALSPRSPSDSDRHPGAHPTSRPCSVIRNPATSSQRNSNPILPENVTKKRRMTLTNEKTLIHPPNGHVSSLTSSNQSSSSPDSRTVGRNSISAKHTPELLKDPASPLVIGFHQPRDPIAMQQVANTLKLKEEQKRLIEQRRNSFAGQSSLKSFSFPHNPPTANSNGPPTSQNNQCSPRSAHANRARTSISKPVPPPPMNNNPHKNGLTKLLWHPGLPTPLSNSSRPAPQPPHGPHSPNVSLSPINETSAPRRQSISQSQHRAPASQPALNQQTHHHRADSPEPSHEASRAKHSPLAGSSSTLASRRDEVKVKNLQLTAQALQAHLIDEPSVRSAPIRGGFFQNNNTPNNGNLVQGPLISRQSLTTRQETTDPRGHAPEFQNPFPNKFHSHPSNLNPDPQHALRSRHPTGGVRPGHAHEHPSPASDIYHPGLERRRTMHAGSLIQVPTLNHFIGKSSQAHGGGGPAHGPPPAVKLTNPNGRHEIHGNGQQKNAHHPSGAPHQPNSQPSFQHSASSYAHPRQMQRSRHSMGAEGIPSKHMFLQLFETFYDSLTDCKILQSNLEDHDRRSGQLLALLQQSSSMFEKMLEDRMSAIQKEFTRDMQVLEARIDRLEERAPPTDPSVECNNKTRDKEDTIINPNEMSSANPPRADAPKNPNHQEESEASRKRSASRTSGSATGSNGDERTITSRLDKLEASMGIRTTDAPQDPASSPQP